MEGIDRLADLREALDIVIPLMKGAIILIFIGLIVKIRELK